MGIPHASSWYLFGALGVESGLSLHKIATTPEGAALTLRLAEKMTKLRPLLNATASGAELTNGTKLGGGSPITTIEKGIKKGAVKARDAAVNVGEKLYGVDGKAVILPRPNFTPENFKPLVQVPKDVNDPALANTYARQRGR